MFNNVVSFSVDVATEKNQQNLLVGIEGFDSTKLKHAETQEKNPLPDQDGEHFYRFSSAYSLRPANIPMFQLLSFISSHQAGERED